MNKSDEKLLFEIVAILIGLISIIGYRVAGYSFEECLLTSILGLIIVLSGIRVE